MDSKNINDQNPEEESKKANEKTPPSADPLGGGDFLSQLGLDLGEFEGAVGDFITEQPTSGTESIESVDGKIELKIDEELDSQIDEEAKMFLADKHFRAGEFYEALIPALELNIRVRQGRAKRDDVLVKRQDEILFESNFQVGTRHLGFAAKSGGQLKTHHRIMALLHLYAAIDQRFLPGQEEKRRKITSILRTLIAGSRVGQFYMKVGTFSKLGIPGPEDSGTKAEIWSYLGLKETESVAKELYMLLAYNYDLSYYRYQISLAKYYLDVNRVREGTRYIQIPLPLTEEEGMQFLVELKKKSPKEFDIFVERSFKNDFKRLNTLVEKKQMFQLTETINDWRRRLNNMKSDVAYGNSTVRLEYLHGFAKLFNDILTENPNHFTDSLLTQYQSSVLTNKLPLIQDFVYFQLYFALEINEKTKNGVNIYDVNADAFTTLSYAVDEAYRYHSDPETAKKHNISKESVNLQVSKAYKAFESSLNAKGIKLSKEVKLVP